MLRRYLDELSAPVQVFEPKSSPKLPFQVWSKTNTFVIRGGAFVAIAVKSRSQAGMRDAASVVGFRREIGQESGAGIIFAPGHPYGIIPIAIRASRPTTTLTATRISSVQATVPGSTAATAALRRNLAANDRFGSRPTNLRQSLSGPLFPKATE